MGIHVWRLEWDLESSAMDQKEIFKKDIRKTSGDLGLGLCYSPVLSKLLRCKYMSQRRSLESSF